VTDLAQLLQETVGSPTWQEVALVGLNVLQTIALAYMATRSARVRRTDRDRA
jgi:uncharacterized membrane protein